MNLLEAVQQLYNDPTFTKEKNAAITLHSKGEMLTIPWRLVLDGEWAISIPITDPEFLESVNGLMDAMGIEPGKDEKVVQ